MKKLTGILLGGSLILGNVLGASAADKAKDVKQPVKDVKQPVVAQENVNQDLGVADAVAEALNNNLDIKTSQETSKYYKSAYRTTSLKKLGNIKVTNHAYKASVSSGSEISELGYDKKYLSSKRNAGGIQLTIPILDVTLDANIGQAKYQSENGKRALQKQIEDTMYEVQKTYHYAQYYAQQEQDAQECLKDMTDHHALAQKKFDRKKVSQLDVFNAEVELAKSKTDLIEAQGNKKIYTDELRKLLNIKPNVNIKLTEKLSDFKILDGDKQLLAKPVDELVKLALNNRQDLKISENNVKIAKKGVTAAVGESLPTFSLVASNSWNSIKHTGFDAFAREQGYEFDTRSADQDRTIGVFASMTLDASNMASVDTAKKNVNIAKANLENKRLAIETEVKQTVEQIKKALDQIKSSAMNVQLTKASNDLAGVRYYKDLCSSEARTDALKEYRQAKVSHSYALAEAKIAIAKLKNLVGNNVKIK